MPVVTDVNHTRADKSIIYEQLLEVGNMVVVFGPENFLSQGKDAIKYGSGIAFFQVIEQSKNIIKESKYFVARKLVFYIAEQTVEIAEQQLFLILHPIKMQ